MTRKPLVTLIFVLEPSCVRVALGEDERFVIVSVETRSTSGKIVGSSTATEAAQP